MRTGGKASHDVNDLLTVISDSLDSTESELRNRAAVHMENLVLDFPGIEQSSDGWKLTKPIEDGKVYQLAFDGNESDAEILEKPTRQTNLALFGSPKSTSNLSFIIPKSLFVQIITTEFSSS